MHDTFLYLRNSIAIQIIIHVPSLHVFNVAKHLTCFKNEKIYSIVKSLKLSYNQNNITLHICTGSTVINLNVIGGQQQTLLSESSSSSDSFGFDPASRDITVLDQIEHSQAGVQIHINCQVRGSNTQVSGL